MCDDVAAESERRDRTCAACAERSGSVRWLLPLDPKQALYEPAGKRARAFRPEVLVAILARREVSASEPELGVMTSR